MNILKYGAKLYCGRRTLSQKNGGYLMDNGVDKIKNAVSFLLRGSVTVKIILIGFMTLILQIPAFQIMRLIDERQSRKAEA